MERAVFFDRDGVLNELVTRDGGLSSPRNVAQFTLVPGIKSIIKEIQSQEFLVIVVSNQPDIARGLMTESELVKMTDILYRELELDDVFYCVHDDPDPIGCRKPAPGLFFQAKEKWGIDFNRSLMIGDTWKDAQAAAAAGIKMLLLNRDYNNDFNYRDRIESLSEIINYLSLQAME